MKLMKEGSRGDNVRELQTKLTQLGFEIGVDGIFGNETAIAVTKLQTLFGYDVDAIVGEGTMGLIDAQIGYSWNVQNPDAAEAALKSQGKSVDKVSKEFSQGTPAGGKGAPTGKGAPSAGKGAPAGKGVPQKGVAKVTGQSKDAPIK